MASIEEAMEEHKRLSRLAREAFDAGDLDKAEDLITKAEDACPGNPTMSTARGYIARERARRAAVEAHIQHHANNVKQFLGTAEKPAQR